MENFSFFRSSHDRQKWGSSFVSSIRLENVGEHNSLLEADFLEIGVFFIPNLGIYVTETVIFSSEFIDLSFER